MHIGVDANFLGTATRQVKAGLCGAFLAATSFILLASATVAAAATFTVNNTLDAPDVTPGDTLCAAGPGDNACTLRAAIQEANALDGNDTIVLPAGTFYLTRAGYDDAALDGDLDIQENVTITGAGPNLTIIDGNSATTTDRVFDIKKCEGGLTFACDAQHPPINVSISGVAIEHGFGNSAGGGILNSGVLSLTNCLVSNNRVDGKYGSGGGIYNSGTLVIANSTISNNQAAARETPYGAGIYTTGPASIDGSTISDNSFTTSGGYGGGIYGSNATPVVTNSTISGNTAAVGGGIAGSVDISNSTIFSNGAGSGGGAAVFSGSYSSFVNTTISANYSDQEGAGILASGSVTTLLHHTTVTQNTANADERGSAIAGGVYNTSSGPFYSYNSIIAQNGTVVVVAPKNKIVLDDCAGTITSVGKTIFAKVDAAHCTLSGDVNDVTLADPKLGSLQENGGPTRTHALLAGSPAIDSGPTAACIENFTGTPLTVDQRGAHRPAGALCDVGAFELQPDLIFTSGFQL